MPPNRYRSLAVIFLAAAAPAWGQPETAPPPDGAPAAPVEPGPAPPDVPAAMRSPRAVLEAFVTRMREDRKREAAELLDLSQLAAIAADSRGPDLALKLYRLIPALGDPPADVAEDYFRRMLGTEVSTLDYSTAPDDPAREAPWPLAEWLRNPSENAERVVIARGSDNRWRFDAETVSQIDALYEVAEQRIDELAEKRAETPAPAGVEEPSEPTETISLWLRKLFPPSLRKTYFLMPTYQWLLLIGLLPIGRAAELLVWTVFTWLGDRVLNQIDHDFEEAGDTTRRVWRPVGRLATAAVWTAGAYVIELPSGVTNVLLTLLWIIAIVAAALALFRVLDLVSGYLSRRAKRRDRKFDDLFLPLATSTAKIAVVLGAIVVAVAAFSKTLPSTLIGGLGIGGVAIALASQQTLSNFIGSITLLFDRPFEVGDWVRIDNLEGEVEALGFRSTKLRTGLNSQVIVPNSKLADTSVDNWGRRKYRRYLNKLGLEYGTPPERIEAFCEGVRELIRRHPHTRKDFYAAYFNDFGPSSLDMIVVVYFEVPDWATELRERHRLLADIARLADSIGVAFAFPTQTLHLHRGEEAPEPPELTDAKPDLAGARAAAEIAGELPNYQDRPGKVKFPGPTPIEPGG